MLIASAVAKKQNACDKLLMSSIKSSTPCWQHRSWFLSHTLPQPLGHMAASWLPHCFSPAKSWIRGATWWGNTVFPTPYHFCYVTFILGSLFERQKAPLSLSKRHWQSRQTWPSEKEESRHWLTILDEYRSLTSLSSTTAGRKTFFQLFRRIYDLES